MGDAERPRCFLEALGAHGTRVSVGPLNRGPGHRGALVETPPTVGRVTQSFLPRLR